METNRSSVWRFAWQTALFVAVLCSSPGHAQDVACCLQLSSGAMKPTLAVGQRVATMKYAEGVKPVYGDLVVFLPPPNPSRPFILRVVGLPGDRVKVSGGQLHINDRAVERTRAEDFVENENGRILRI